MGLIKDLIKIIVGGKVAKSVVREAKGENSKEYIEIEMGNKKRKIKKNGI